MGALGSLASVGLNLALAEQAARRQNRSVEGDRDQQVQGIQQKLDDERRIATDRLRRQLATQRARAGAAGVASSATSNAVLRGLIQTAQADNQARAADAQQEVDRIRQRARQASRRNLLELASTATRASFGVTSGRTSSLLD